jgi:PAS domain-containing protein
MENPDAPLFASADNETLESMLNSIGDAVCMTDKDLVFMAANNLFAAFYGLKDPRQLLNKCAFEVYPEFKKSVFYEACQATIETGEITTRFGYSANLKNWVSWLCTR